MGAETMNDDLKDYRAPVDAFQIIEDSAAALALLCMAIMLLAFWGAYG